MYGLGRVIRFVNVGSGDDRRERDDWYYVFFDYECYLWVLGE